MLFQNVLGKLGINACVRVRVLAVTDFMPR